MQALIVSIALMNGIDPNLLLAVAFKETRMKHVITWNDGGSPSYGALQTKEIAKRQVASEGDLENESDAIDIGTKYLMYNIKRCKSIISGLNGFNSGHCINKPTKYTNDVLKYYNEFRIKNLYTNLY